MNREQDPRVEAYYKEQKLEEIPKWVVNHNLYKHWLFNTGRLDELALFKKRNKQLIRRNTWEEIE